MQRGKGQEVPGRQQKEEKKKAQQELQHQKENRTESVDSHLLEFITDINTLDWVKLIFFFFFLYILFCNTVWKSLYYNFAKKV